LLSLDGNVLPTSTSEHARLLADAVVAFYSAGGGSHVLRRGKDKKAVLSTFGGADASFGCMGWSGFLTSLKTRGLDVSPFRGFFWSSRAHWQFIHDDLLMPPLLSQIFFVPSFFKPPHELIANPIIDGIFAWNNGWRLGDGPLTTKEDEPFLRCVSPHYIPISLVLLYG
jgi:hypothetical protein